MKIYITTKSGKRYQFLYKRFLGAVAIAGAVVTASFFGGKAVLDAWDKDYELRMEKQEKFLQSVEESSFKQTSFDHLYKGGDN